MPSVVVLQMSGSKKTVESSISDYTPETAGKLLKKSKGVVQIGSYPYNDVILSLWSCKEGKAGNENKHELPPPCDTDIYFGDILVTAGEDDLTVEGWDAFYTEAFGGFEDLEEEEEAIEEEVEEVESEVEAEEEEEVDDEEDDDCYDDDEGAGSSKRRSGRKKTTQTMELRRLEMGVRSKIKLPSNTGKRAPKWQTETELEEEEY